MGNRNPLARARRGFRMYWNMYVRRRTPTIVLSPGHVGSTSLYKSLLARGEFVLHVPTLTTPGARNEPGSYTWAYQHVKQPGRPARIVSIARDPVAAMVSEFFSKVRWMSDVKRGAVTLPVETLLDMFNQDYFEQKRHLKRLRWFEEQMNPSLGIDIYAIPFDPAVGYVRFQSGVYDIVVLRTEIANEVKGQVVGALVGIPDLQVLHINRSDQKGFADNYAAFKERLRVPAEHLDEIYGSRFANKFYSTEEIAAARKRWGG
jgi:hypothetical protein